MHKDNKQAIDEAQLIEYFKPLIRRQLQGDISIEEMLDLATSFMRSGQPKQALRQISPEERYRRSEVIRRARNNVRLEGIILDDDEEQLNRRYINGEISSDELSLLGMAHIKAKFMTYDDNSSHE